MCKDFASDRRSLETAENARFLRCFSAAALTSCFDEDCYTFEGFAPIPDEIHTTYYYHYKRKRNGLKEETKWS
jgi:hypothetical protein